MIFQTQTYALGNGNDMFTTAKPIVYETKTYPFSFDKYRIDFVQL